MSSLWYWGFCCCWNTWNKTTKQQRREGKSKRTSTCHEAAKHSLGFNLTKAHTCGESLHVCGSHPNIRDSVSRQKILFWFPLTWTKLVGPAWTRIPPKRFDLCQTIELWIKFCFLMFFYFFFKMGEMNISFRGNF